MNELLVVLYILVTLAVAYLWFYPTFVGNNVRAMAWWDVLVSGFPFGISAVLFWQSDPVFTLFTFELNWFFFTLITLVLIEAPILLLYLKARNLSSEYWAQFSMAPKGSPDAGWAAASVKGVEKSLNDSRWDGLRTPGAKRFLLVSSNVFLIGSSALVFNLSDNQWTIYTLVHVLFVFVFWFLLRQSVRLVADAPQEALDEMLLKKRNESYVIAYRWLAAFATGLAIALLVFIILVDSDVSSDGFNYTVSFTWPQTQAFFWFLMGYLAMLPSMALLSVDLKSTKAKGEN
jgi:hypothetical protein